MNSVSNVDRMRQGSGAGVLLLRAALTWLSGIGVAMAGFALLAGFCAALLSR